MRLFHGTDNAEIQRPTVLTLGVFDGLHLGHQLIMRTVVERAREAGAVPTVITFDPHPRAVLHPESAPPLLQTFDQKIEGFGVLGIEQTIVVRFTKEFSSVSAPKTSSTTWLWIACTRAKSISARASLLVTTARATSSC